MGGIRLNREFFGYVKAREDLLHHIEMRKSIDIVIVDGPILMMVMKNSKHPNGIWIFFLNSQVHWTINVQMRKIPSIYLCKAEGLNSRGYPAAISSKGRQQNGFILCWNCLKWVGFNLSMAKKIIYTVVIHHTLTLWQIIGVKCFFKCVTNASAGQSRSVWH